MVKRKSSKALANSGHIVSNFPDEACCRATGSPMDSTLSRDDTASFQVLSDGQAYFRLKGVLKVLKAKNKTKKLMRLKHKGTLKINLDSGARKTFTPLPFRQKTELI